MTTRKPKIPTDDFALDQIEHALGAYYVSDENGDPIVVGADFNLQQLLQFWSGFDSRLLTATDDPDVEDYHGTMFTERDLVEALVREVRALRGELSERRGTPPGDC